MSSKPDKASAVAEILVPDHQLEIPSSIDSPKHSDTSLSVGARHQEFVTTIFSVSNGERPDLLETGEDVSQKLEI